MDERRGECGPSARSHRFALRQGLERHADLTAKRQPGGKSSYCRPIMTTRPRPVLRLLLCALVSSMAGAAALPAHANDRDYNPRAYDLRAALFPVAFRAGVVQNHFGSALRVEYDLLPRMTLGAYGRAAWLPFGRFDQFAMDAGAVFHFHLVDELVVRPLVGSVYPRGNHSPPPLGTGHLTGGDDMLGLPISERMGGPPLTLPEKDTSRYTSVRVTHSLRAGYQYTRFAQRRELAEDAPNAEGSGDSFLATQQHGFGLGYAHGTHWNLLTDGERDVGFRRFYGDVLLAPQRFAKARVVEGADERADPSVTNLGIRLGMEGTWAGFWPAMAGLGLAYTLEIGGWYGDEYLEGFLFFALGAAFDYPTRWTAPP